MQKTRKSFSTEKMVTIAVIIALISALQAFSSVAARIGLFSFALGLFPATVGSVMYGKKESIIFGSVLGIVILATDATAYALYSVNFLATVLVVLAKSIASTFVTALIFQLLKRYNRYVAIVVAAILSPVINPGIFIGGVCIFFKDFFAQFISGEVFIIGFILMLLTNFIIETIINVVLSPVVLRVIDVKKPNRF